MMSNSYMNIFSMGQIGLAKALPSFLRLASITLVTGIALLPSNFAQASELVVISSTTDKFQAGQILDTSATIDLAPDAKITLISESGKIIAVSGPHSGPLGQTGKSSPESALIKSIQNIIHGPKKESGSLGVVRSVGKPKKSDNPWAISINRTGTFCVSLSKPVIFWRPNATKTRPLSLLNKSTDKEVKTVWHSGQHELHWPRLLPIVDGATYRVDLAGKVRMTKITLKLVPKLPSDAHSAVWMMSNGCQKQAKHLIVSLK